MITPAKWQTAEADQKIASKMSYGQFRKKLVPHMREVVFYPDAKDVFDIMQIDGVTYYIMDKQLHRGSCIVRNICTRQKYFNSDSCRDISNQESLHNIGYNICKYLGDVKSYKFDSRKRTTGVYIVDAMCFPGHNIV